MQGETTLTILNGAKLALWAGQSVALVAPSGAGKSTLLTAISHARPKNRLVSVHHADPADWNP